MGLKFLENHLQRITLLGGKKSRHLKGHPDIYQKSYWYRIEQVLIDSCPRISKALGKSKFSSAVESYIRKQSPGFKSIDELSLDFARHIAKKSKHRGVVFAAKLDAAFHESHFYFRPKKTGKVQPDSPLVIFLPMATRVLSKDGVVVYNTHGKPRSKRLNKSDIRLLEALLKSSTRSLSPEFWLKFWPNSIKPAQAQAKLLTWTRLRIIE